MGHQVAYVVVTYESSRHIDGLLDSVAANADDRAAIVVVDNGSKDDTVERARRHRSSPLVVENENVGYGAGCNDGAGTVAAETYFFLNPDLRLAPGATERLLAHLDADPSVAAVGPAIVDPAGTYQAVSAGAEPSLLSAIGHFLLLSRLPLIGPKIPALQLAPTRTARAVDWISGAAFLVRAEAFAQVGGFDRSIFLYMEDVDLCRRLRAAGWRVLYDPSVVLEHEMGGSQGAEAVDRWYESFHAYVARHRGSMHAVSVALVAAIGLAARAVYYGLRGNGPQARRLRRAARNAAGHVRLPG